jgi:hypothetical protein
MLLKARQQGSCPSQEKSIMQVTLLRVRHTRLSSLCMRMEQKQVLWLWWIDGTKCGRPVRAADLAYQVLHRHDELVSSDDGRSVWQEAWPCGALSKVPNPHVLQLFEHAATFHRHLQVQYL